jgi:hypothetical protein
VNIKIPTSSSRCLTGPVGVPTNLFLRTLAEGLLWPPDSHSTVIAVFMYLQGSIFGNGSLSPTVVETAWRCCGPGMSTQSLQFPLCNYLWVGGCCQTLTVQAAQLCIWVGKLTTSQLVVGFIQVFLDPGPPHLSLILPWAGLDTAHPTLGHCPSCLCTGFLTT